MWRELANVHVLRQFLNLIPRRRAFSQGGGHLAYWHLNQVTVACHAGVKVVCDKEEGPYCPSSSAEATAEEATVRSPLLKCHVTKIEGARGVNEGLLLDYLTVFLKNLGAILEINAFLLKDL